MTSPSDSGFYHFFGIEASPFSIAPDPHYLYLGEKHQEALAHLAGDGVGVTLAFVFVFEVDLEVGHVGGRA